MSEPEDLEREQQRAYLESLNEDQRRYLRKHVHSGELSEEQRKYLRKHVPPPQLDLPFTDPTEGQP
jgi:hypothetical protein